MLCHPVHFDVDELLVSVVPVLFDGLHFHFVPLFVGET